MEDNKESVGKVESEPGKVAEFIRNHKKLLISLSIVLVLSVALVIFFSSLLIPHWHYMQAKKLIESGEYKEAYEHLYACIDYKDSRELREDFRVEFGYEENIGIKIENGELIGELYYNYEREYNTYGYETKEISYNDIDDPTDAVEYVYRYSKKNYGIMVEKYIDGEWRYRSEHILDRYGNRLDIISSHGRLESYNEFNFDENWNVVKVVVNNRPGEMAMYIQYAYNEDNYLIGRIQYDSEGRKSVEEKYDPDGMRLEWIRYQGNEEVKEKYTYTYDQTGNLIEECRYFDEEKSVRIEYSYDAMGNLTEKIVHRESDETRSRCVNSYDEHGRLVRIDVYDGTGRHGGYTGFTYDDKGNMTGEAVYNKLGEITSRYVYCYNEDGYLASKTYCDYVDGKLYLINKSVYDDYYVFYEPDKRQY